MSSLFRFASIASVVLLFGTVAVTSGEILEKSFKDGRTISSVSGLKFHIKKRDDSGSLGVANMCTGLLLGIAKDPDRKKDLQDLYQHHLQEIQNQNLGKPEDIAESIGIVRGAKIQAIAENPSVQKELTVQADQCLADMFEPSCLAPGFSCDVFDDKCCDKCIGEPLGFCD